MTIPSTPRLRSLRSISRSLSMGYSDWFNRMWNPRRWAIWSHPRGIRGASAGDPPEDARAGEEADQADTHGQLPVFLYAEGADPLPGFCPAGLVEVVDSNPHRVAGHVEALAKLTFRRSLDRQLVPHNHELLDSFSLREGVREKIHSGSALRWFS